MLWKRHAHRPTQNPALDAQEVGDAYDRGRRDERKARKHHPIMMTLTLAMALVGGVVLALAAKEGSFARGGVIVDHGLAVAANRAEPVGLDAGASLKEEAAAQAAS